MLLIRVLCALVLSAALLPQTIEDILPPGIERTESGALRWRAFRPVDCENCGGSGRIDCRHCSLLPEASCGFCRDGDAECHCCAGNATALDPFLEFACLACAGSGRFACPECNVPRGVRRAGDPKRRDPCARCTDRAVACPLCDGRGRRAGPAAAGPDPRQGPPDKLDARIATLTRVQRALETLRPRNNGADVAESVAEFLVLVQNVADLGLVDGVDDRLHALLEDLDDAAASHALACFCNALRDEVESTVELLCTCSWLLRVNGGTLPAPVPANTLDWEFVFARDGDPPKRIYCLLGVGFVSMDFSDDTESVIQAWFASHPDAQVYSLADLDAHVTGRPESKVQFAWVVDGEHHLAVHLVEQGCIDAEAIRSPTPRVEIPLADYLEVLQKAVAAESKAREDLRGIWKERELRRRQRSGG